MWNKGIPKNPHSAPSIVNANSKESTRVQYYVPAQVGETEATRATRGQPKRLSRSNPRRIGGNVILCVVILFHSRVVSALSLWRTKLTNSLGKQNLIFWLAPPRGTLRVSRKQNLLYPFGPVIKCVIFTERKSRWRLTSLGSWRCCRRARSKVLKVLVK